MCLAALGPARAGSYSPPIYTGGSVTGSDGYSAPYTLSYGTYGGGHTTDDLRSPGPPVSYTGGTANCSGTITATFTWQPEFPGDPPPSQVFVSQTSSASASFVSQYSQGGSATANDGLGDPSGQTVSGTTYEWLPGGAILTVTCGPSASATGASSLTYPVNPYLSCSASVGYSVTVSPPAITLTGAAQDLTGEWSLLVGQPCTSSLVGVPPGYTVSNYTWGVTGTTFQTWQPTTPALGGNPANPNAPYYIPGSGPSNLPTASWYWNDLIPNTNPIVPTTEQVTCTATFTPPPGQPGSPTPVSMATPVKVYGPKWRATGNGGGMFVSNTSQDGPLSLSAGADQPGFGAGMTIAASVDSPTLMFGAGSLELVQLLTSIGNGYTNTADEYLDPNNGKAGLDGSYPYGWLPNAPLYTTVDSPGFSIPSNVNNTLEIFAGETFQDYLMYFPPGSGQCVPLAQFTWSTDGIASRPSTGRWNDYAKQNNGSDWAGPVTPNNSYAPFQPSNTFPVWTQIIKALAFVPQ